MTERPEEVTVAKDDIFAPRDGDFVPFTDETIDQIDMAEYPYDEGQREVMRQIRIVAWPAMPNADNLDVEDEDADCYVELCAFIYGEAAGSIPITDILKHGFDCRMYSKNAEIIALTKLRDECDRLIAQITADPDDEDEDDEP